MCAPKKLWAAQSFFSPENARSVAGEQFSPGLQKEQISRRY